MNNRRATGLSTGIMCSSLHGEDSRYLYGSGYVRALENKMLDAGTVRRLVESGNEAEFLSILSRTRYAAGSADGVSAGLKKASLDSAALAKKLLLGERPREMAFMKYDFYNLSALLKARHAEVGAEPSLFEEGLVNTTLLREAVNTGRTSGMPAHMTAAMEKAETAHTRASSTLQMEVAVEHAFLETLADKARGTGRRFFTEFAAITADVYNITSFFRVKKFMPGMRTEDALSEEGSAGKRPFSDYANDYEGIARFFSGTAYAAITEEGAACMREKRPLARLETMGAGLILRFLDRARYVTMGPEPVFAYFRKLEEEIKSLNIISAGKRAGAPPEMLAERAAVLL